MIGALYSLISSLNQKMTLNHYAISPNTEAGSESTPGTLAVPDGDPAQLWDLRYPDWDPPAKPTPEDNHHVHGGQRRSLQILFPLEQGSIVNAHWPKYTMLHYLINSTNKSEATETFNTDRRNSWDELSDICQQSPCPHFQPTLQQFPYINGRTVISTFAYWYRRSLGVIYGMKETMTTVNGIIPPLCESLSSRTAVWVPKCGSFVGRCRTSFWPLVFERGIQPSVKLFAKLWGDFSRMLLAKVDPNFALLTLLYIFTF